MVFAFLAVLFGLALLVWSADRFVEGAAAACRHFGMPSLLIGMLVVGFGTSAPEIMVSAFASFGGTPGLALGNAYGSNISNLALILGLTSLVRPVAVRRTVLHRELPILTAVTVLAICQSWDGELSRGDATVLLLVFFGLMTWTLRRGLRRKDDAFARQVEQELAIPTVSFRHGMAWLVTGLALLILSSRILVWGAVEIARGFGVSDLIIGLTVVAIGTSLPELASSLSAARKKEDEIALGNVIGSNIFNTLVVVGIAGTVHPMAVAREVLARDMPVMLLLTLSIFAFGYGGRQTGRINRWEGAALFASFLCYTGYLVYTAAGQ